VNQASQPNDEVIKQTSVDPKTSLKGQKLTGDQAVSQIPITGALQCFTG